MSDKNEKLKDYFIGLNKDIYPASWACDDCARYVIWLNDKLFCTDLKAAVESNKRHPDCKLKCVGYR